MDAQVFGRFIQERRKALGMSQQQLAQKLFVTAKAVSRWERGIGFPGIDTLQPLADALEVSIAELMQSRMMDRELSKEEAAEVVTETIDSILKQEKKQRMKIYLLFFLVPVLFAVQLFLLQIYINMDPNADSRWTRFWFYEIVMLIGICGSRAVYYIIHNECSKLKAADAVEKGLMLGFLLALTAIFLIFGMFVWRMGEHLVGLVFGSIGPLIGLVGYFYFLHGKKSE